MTGPTSPSAIIIGGGIIGLTAAERLIADGYRVTLIEREKVAAGASAGNAAGLAFPEVMPLASPGIFTKAFKWFFDPLGPFAVVIKDLPWVTGWLLRFAWASRKSQYNRSLAALAAINLLSREHWPDMLARVGMEEHRRTDGALHIYEDRRNFEAAVADWKDVEAFGISVQIYEGEALHQFQPGLSERYVAGIFTPDWHNISNPRTICEVLHQRLEERGLETVYGTVNHVSADANSASVHLDGQGAVSADHVVVAAGPWSNRITKLLGDNIPIIGERGYNTTLPRSAMALNRALVLSEEGFIVSSLADGVRVGGASEIARLGRLPNYKRSRAMLQKARERVPGLNTENGVEWMGARPTTADTLPVIGRSSASDRIVYAFGHAHLGLTQSAATAKLVSELIRGEQPSIDLTPFNPQRF